MLIPHLDRHLAVCGLTELPGILRRDRNFWNVISILEPSTLPPPLQGAKRTHRLTFHDIEDQKLLDTEGARLASSEDIAGALEFVDRFPQEPMLIHCRAGISRSTAFAVVLLVRGHVISGEAPVVEDVVEQLLAIRRQAVPNVLVMRLGFGLFMSATDAADLVKNISNDFRLMNNRFINPL